MVEFAWLFCFGNIKDLENEQGNGTSSRLNGFKNSSGYSQMIQEQLIEGSLEVDGHYEKEKTRSK